MINILIAILVISFLATAILQTLAIGGMFVYFSDERREILGLLFLFLGFGVCYFVPLLIIPFIAWLCVSIYYDKKKERLNKA